MDIGCLIEKPVITSEYRLDDLNGFSGLIGLVQRPRKPENLLLDQHGQLKLTVSRTFASNKNITTRCCFEDKCGG